MRVERVEDSYRIAGDPTPDVEFANRCLSHLEVRAFAGVDPVLLEEPQRSALCTGLVRGGDDGSPVNPKLEVVAGEDHVNVKFTTLTSVTS